MSNIEQALKSAIEAMENADNIPPVPFGIRCIRAVNQCKSALAEIEKCEPVVWKHFDEAYKKAVKSSEPDDWMNAALMAQQVRRKQLDISPQPQNVEKCEPVGWTNELQLSYLDDGDACLVYPDTTECPIAIYTSPINKEWLGLTDKRIEEIAKRNGAWQLYSSLKIFDFVANINDELKQLNTKG